MDILTVAILAGCAGFFAAAGLAIIPLRRAERALIEAEARTDAARRVASTHVARYYRANDDLIALRRVAYVRNAKGQIKRWSDIRD